MMTTGEWILECMKERKNKEVVKRNWWRILSAKHKKKR